MSTLLTFSVCLSDFYLEHEVSVLVLLGTKKPHAVIILAVLILFACIPDVDETDGTGDLLTSFIVSGGTANSRFDIGKTSGTCV